MTDTPEPIRVVLARRLEDLPVLHEAVDHSCRAHRLLGKPVGQLQLALEEHVTTIIRHGGKPNDTSRIRMPMTGSKGDTPT